MLLVASIAYVGCSNTPRQMASYVDFRGKAVDDSGSPLGNVRLMLQPTEDGYEIELKTDTDGSFQGEGVPGEYIYYFLDSKGLPDSVPADFLEPNLSHLVEVQADSEIVCGIQ